MVPQTPKVFEASRHQCINFLLMPTDSVGHSKTCVVSNCMTISCVHCTARTAHRAVLYLERHDPRTREDPQYSPANSLMNRNSRRTDILERRKLPLDGNIWPTCEQKRRVQWRTTTTYGMIFASHGSLFTCIMLTSVTGPLSFYYRLVWCGGTNIWTDPEKLLQMPQTSSQTFLP